MRPVFLPAAPAPTAPSERPQARTLRTESESSSCGTPLCHYSCSLDNMPRRTSVRRKSDMRRPKRDKRSELAVKYCCHGSVHRAKPEFTVWQRYPAQTFGRLAAKDFETSISNASLHWDDST